MRFPRLIEVFTQAPANRPHAEGESSSEQDRGRAMADQQEGDPQAIVENPFRLVVVAASAGGIAALTGVFPAAVAIVQHRPPRAPSVLAHVLNRRSAMPVTDAKDGELIRPARAYLAPADYHLLVNADGTFSLTQSQKVHGTRPAAEHLFEISGEEPERANHRRRTDRM